MSSSITWDALRELASFRSPGGCALSVYVGFDPSSTPTVPDVEKKFNALLSEAEKAAERFAGDHACRMALREDVGRLRSWWDDFERDGSHGIAIFASSREHLFKALALPDPVDDGVHLGPELHLTPLVSRAGRGDGTLVAVVSRERGVVYRLRDGRLEEVVDESEEQPGQHNQGGWSQARYQRHIENLVQAHLRSVGGEIDKRLRRATGLRIVIVAPEEMRSEFESALTPEARDAIVGWATAEAHAGPIELVRVVRPLVDQARARSEEEAVDRWREGLGRQGPAAAGWADTLTAASDARVALLLLVEGKRPRAWQCPRDGRASATAGECPLDGSPLEERQDAGDVAVHQVLAHGGTVITVGAGALGDEQVGALLRF